MRFENERRTDFSCDDAVTLYTQYSTQWDALSHVGQEFDADQDGKEELVYYNGYRGGVDILGPDDPKGPGALNLGIEKMAETCVQGRGVMADLSSRFGADRKLVGYDDLMQILEEDDVVVEEGDMFCIHTGWTEAVAAAKGSPDVELLHHAYAVLDGSDARLLKWIEESGISVPSLTISPSKPFRRRARKTFRDFPGFRSTDVAWSSSGSILASCGA
jgi:hypothetical protein